MESCHCQRCLVRGEKRGIVHIKCHVIAAHVNNDDSVLSSIHTDSKIDFVTSVYYSNQYRLLVNKIRVLIIFGSNLFNKECVFFGLKLLIFILITTNSVKFRIVVIYVVTGTVCEVVKQILEIS